MGQDSHSVRHTTIGTGVGGAILTLLLAFRDAAVSVARRAWSDINALWGLAAASYSLPGWLFLIIGVLAAITLISAVRALIPCLVEQPKHRKYVEDQMHGAVWRSRGPGD